MGLLTIADGWGETIEYDTVACKHCGIPVAVLDRRKITEAEYRPRRKCSRCDGAICRVCSERLEEMPPGACSPLAHKLDQALKSGRWDGNLIYRHRNVTRT